MRNVKECSVLVHNTEVEVTEGWLVRGELVVLTGEGTALTAGWSSTFSFAQTYASCCCYVLELSPWVEAL